MPSTHVGASDISAHLKGIKLPANASAIRKHAKENGAPEEVLEILKELPDREYAAASDIATGLSEATEAVKATLPSSSASEVLAAVKGVTFPASRDDLLAAARENGASKDVQDSLASLERKKFHNVIEISKALSESR
jgi:hypothetical protein